MEDEFSWYDIGCAVLALTPFTVAGVFCALILKVVLA